MELSKETTDFILEFVRRLNTQNCRGTADPYFYQVRCIDTVGCPDGCGDDVEYYDSDAAEHYTETELREKCKEDEVDFDEYVDGHCREVSVKDGETFENIFFTEQGYKEHVEWNGHNYRHHKRFDSYVRHAYRNPEIMGLMKAVREIADELKSASQADAGKESK